MLIFIFGNPDVEVDSLPVKLLPDLESAFPEHTFTVLDPNEEWEVPEHMTIIDTVLGVGKVTEFTDLSVFVQAPKMTCHDFDAYTNLLFLKKLGKIKTVHIIGIPPQTTKGEVIKGVTKYLAE